MALSSIGQNRYRCLGICRLISNVIFDRFNDIHCTVLDVALDDSNLSIEDR